MNDILRHPWKTKFRGKLKEFNEKYRHFQISDGDLLFASSGASWGKVAWHRDPGFRVMLNTSTMRLCFFNSKFAKNYLFYFLKSEFFRRQLSIQLVGLQPNFGSTHLSRIYIPVPPTAEQHRIVAKIDQLMARCDELEKLRAEREQKRRSVHAAALKQLLDASTSSFPVTPAKAGGRRESSGSKELDSRLRGNDGDFTDAWQFISQHFGELYAVRENVAELRKAILQLAVMGKLVPQNPNDPPASQLLKEIAAEKKRLVKEGKIKAPKPLSEIKPEEVPYALPQGWEWVRMGDLCNGVTSGSTPPQSIFNDEVGIPFLKVYNIRNQKIDFDYKKQFIDFEYHVGKMKRSTLRPGDLVMNIVGPPLGKVAIIPDDYPEYNCNQAIVLFLSSKKEINQYLYTYLLAGTFLNGIELIGTAGQDNISVTKSKMMPIPLPPLPEQHRIVAKIDQIMALCDTLEQQIDTATGKQTELLNALMAQV